MACAQIVMVGILFIVPILWFKLDPEISNYLAKLKQALKLRLQG
jgi:hypothetical protein